MMRPEFSSIHDLWAVQPRPAWASTLFMLFIMSAVSSQLLPPLEKATRSSKCSPGFALDVIGVPPCLSQFGIGVQIVNFIAILGPARAKTRKNPRKIGLDCFAGNS